MILFICVSLMSMLRKGLTYLLLLATMHLLAGDYYKSDEITFDLVYDSWDNAPMNIQTNNWQSIGFNFAWGADYPFTEKSPLSFFYGLGYSLNKVHHNGNMQLNSPIMVHDEYASLIPLLGEYRINKFSSSFLEIPVEFRYRTHTRFPFRIYFGAKGGYMLKHFNKFQNAEQAYKVSDIPHINKWRVQATGRIGFGMVNFFGSYNLTPLFIPNKGPEIYPFSVGMSLLIN